MTFGILIIRKDAIELILLDIKQMSMVTMHCTVLYCTVLTAQLLDTASETRSNLRLTSHNELL